MFELFFVPIAESAKSSIPWWVWVILIIILLVLLWFWFGRDDEDDVEVETNTSPSDIAVEPDDLKKIEGIGPKVASILAEAGITTFQHMVDAGAEKLETILDEARLQMINADTWPEQAELAASSDWDALENLQDKLKGGKRD